MQMNHSAVWLSQLSRTVAQTQDKQANDYFRGIKAFMHLVTKGSTTVKLGVYGYDYLGNEFTVGEVTASSTGDTLLTVYPAMTTGTGFINDVLPRNWHLKVTPSDANANVYSVCYDLIA
jgi:hypothetical protein